MHFCFLNMPIEFYSPTSGGAIATIIAQVGKELIAAGHRVSVLTAMDDTAVYDVGEVVPLRGARQRYELSFLSRRWSDVRQKIGRWDWPYFEHYLNAVRRHLSQAPPPDVLITFNDLYSPRHLRRVLPHTKIVVWLQNEWRTHPGNIAATVAATDLFLTCSDYIRDWTVKTHGISPAKFAVVPSGVDLQEFFPRANLQPAAGLPKLLFIGRINPDKGPDTVVDAVAALQQEGLMVRLTVAGGLWFYGRTDPMSDPYFRSLHGKMRAVDATYLGHVTRPNVPALVREHDIVCVLSRFNEPFALVSLEAMASGCAVVASNRGGLPQACGGAARLVDPDNRSDVVNALREWVVDPTALLAAKQRSLARAAAASWSVTAETFVKVVTPKERNTPAMSPPAGSLEAKGLTGQNA